MKHERGCYHGVPKISCKLCRVGFSEIRVTKVFRQRSLVCQTLVEARAGHHGQLSRLSHYLLGIFSVT